MSTWAIFTEHLSYCSTLCLRTDFMLLKKKILAPWKPEWNIVTFWGSLMLWSGLLNSLVGQMPLSGMSMSICAALSIRMESLLIKAFATIVEVWTIRGRVKSSPRLPAAFSGLDCYLVLFLTRPHFCKAWNYSFHSWKTAVTEWKRKDSC